MKLKNTTHWPDHFLRRMVAWVCKQVELPARSLKRADFGKRSRGCFNGYAWYRSMRIRVVIGPAKEYPVEPFHYPGRTNDQFLSPRYADQLEGLVGVTAHELQHLHRKAETGHGGGERHTRGEERRIHALFVANRDTLVAEWSAPPAAIAKEKPSAQQRRAGKVQSSLERWQRKLKLAQTKVKKLRRQAAYYDKALAANKSR
jgi:hypothetical protein